MGSSTYPQHAILVPDATSKTKGAIQLAGALAGSAGNPILATAPIALTDGATIAVDASQGNLFQVTLGGNRTIAAPTNPSAGQRLLFRLIQDATGSRTVTWTSGTGGFRFGTTIGTPTLSTAAGKTDYIEFIYNATSNTWDAASVRLGY